MPHLFSESAAKRIVAATRRVEHATPPRGGTRGYDGVDETPPFWVELTAEDPANPGRYAWKKVNPKDREPLVDTDPLIDSGRVDPEDEESDPLYTAQEVNGGPGLKGRKVLVRFVGYDGDSLACYLFASRLRGVVFLVVLEMTYGDPNPVSYVYRVIDPANDEVLAEDAAPSYRPLTGNVPAPATRGLGYFAYSDGAFVLIQAHETFGKNDACEGAEGSA